MLKSSILVLVINTQTHAFATIPPDKMSQMDEDTTAYNDVIIKAKTYRFKLSDEMCDLLLQFSQQHKFNTKDEFKENWDVWTTEYQDEIFNERERLRKLGYDGDIVNKMYKSVRYYYCKKHTKGGIVKEKRRKYIPKNEEFIELVDNFIKRQCNNEHTVEGDVVVCSFKPSDGWNLFIKLYEEDITKEVSRIMEVNTSINKADALHKIKKTFNNRYFIDIRSQTAN